MHLNVYLLSMSMHMHEVNLLTLHSPIIVGWRQGWSRGVGGGGVGHLLHLAPPKKSINISSIILYNTINAFKNYINKWLINSMVF